MTVLHLLGELRPSGAEVMLKLAAPHWQKAGCKLLALATAPMVGEFAPQLEAAGFRIVHLPFSPGFGIVNWAKQFLTLLRTERVDIVHVHGEKNNIVTTTVPRFSGCKVFRTVHNNFPYNGTLRIRKSIERRVSRCFGCTSIAISPSVQANERKRLHNLTTLCWNWFDASFFRPPTRAERSEARNEIGLAEHDIAIVSVGNGNDIKNYSAIIEALALLREKSGESTRSSGENLVQTFDQGWASNARRSALDAACPSTLDSRPSNLLYLMVGNEHPNRIERKTAERLAVSNLIRFCGPQPDVRKYLWAADIFVMPSLYEGFGLAAVEALATGIECIFSDCLGLADFKKFPFSITWTGTNKSSIAMQIASVIATPDTEKRGNRNSMLVRSEFDVERRAFAYLRLWSA